MAMCSVCCNNPGDFQTQMVSASEVSKAAKSGCIPSKWNGTGEQWATTVKEMAQKGTRWFLCQDCYDEIKASSKSQSKTKWWKFW